MEQLSKMFDMTLKDLQMQHKIFIQNSVGNTNHTLFGKYLFIHYKYEDETMKKDSAVNERQ